MESGIASGLRNVYDTMGKRMFFFVVIILVFAAAVLLPRVRAASSDNGVYGEWVGVVQIEKTRSNGTLYPSHRDEGRAVMHVTIRPVWFSFLDRTDAKAELTDAAGHSHPIAIGELAHGWRLPTHWNAPELLSGEPDETMIGKWNMRMDPFVLSFDGASNHELSDGTVYTVSGALSHGR